MSNPDIETAEDAIEIMQELDGRDIITYEKAAEFADAFGVDLPEDHRYVQPTNEILRMKTDDAPAIAMDDLANHILTELGGEEKSSPLVGRGSSADFVYDKALPEIIERADVEVDDE